MFIAKYNNYILQVIERHFTLNNQQKGTDHKLSLEPNEFQRMISNIRNAETICTDSIKNIDILDYISNLSTETEVTNVKLALESVEEKKLLDCEIPCRVKLGKSLVYTQFLQEGTILTAHMICAKVSEPFGVSAEYYNNFIGKKLLVKVQYEENLLENHFTRDFND